MLNLNSILIGSPNPKKLAEFYEKVFAKKPDMDDGGYFGWLVDSCFLTVGPHSEVKGDSKEPQRVIFNFETSEVKKEFARIKKLGSKVIQEPYDIGGMWIATFADPDGNYFQLMSPWDDGKN